MNGIIARGMAGNALGMSSISKTLKIEGLGFREVFLQSDLGHISFGHSKNPVDLFQPLGLFGRDTDLNYYSLFSLFRYHGLPPAFVFSKGERKTTERSSAGRWKEAAKKSSLCRIIF